MEQTDNCNGVSAFLSTLAGNILLTTAWLDDSSGSSSLSLKQKLSRIYSDGNDKRAKRTLRKYRTRYHHRPRERDLKRHETVVHGGIVCFRALTVYLSVDQCIIVV
ncbi:unnamed protein product [Cylicocyclus nassatus]|uniref:Uncharacterized protein n=1 Tax=Cylicocyclus nassatus TaxID=53992 RepID=A0AA36DQJ9_CYLNA|nr:unnamed protein product [Cylicocyclus nassatus]